MSGWDIIEGDNPDFGLFGSRALNVAMLAALFIFFGVLLAPLFGWLDRTLPRPSFRRRFGIVLLPSDLSLSGLAIQVTIGFGLFIATPVRRSHHRFRLCRRGRSQSGLLPDRSGLRSPGAPRGLREVRSRHRAVPAAFRPAPTPGCHGDAHRRSCGARDVGVVPRRAGHGEHSLGDASDASPTPPRKGLGLTRAQPPSSARIRLAISMAATPAL